ncbi:MAG: cell division protein FtsZ, partial [Candidatus Limivicinus sp.]
AASLVQEAAHPDANIIFGATFDDSLDDEIRVTVIATGFEEGAAAQAAAAPAAQAAPAPRAQGLFTGAAEKAAAAAPVAPAAPAAEPAAPAVEEDPFDSIFKIFNTK